MEAGGVLDSWDGSELTVDGGNSTPERELVDGFFKDLLELISLATSP